MQAGAQSVEVGVQLKNALAKIKAARGEKPEFGLDFSKGNTTGSLTIKDGKPSIGLQFSKVF